MPVLRLEPRSGFPDLVRRTRLRAGLTQQQLADLSALSVRAVRDLEAGRVRRPRPDTVRLLADALRLDSTGHSEFLAAATGNVGLPAEAQLFGRDAELAILQDLLLAGAQRLISVVGLPGVGKSRLVDEVGHRAAVLGWSVSREQARLPAADGRIRLLIVDPVSPGPAVDQLIDLHRREPALRMLLCAAAPLRLPGERVLPLAGLPIPAPGSGSVEQPAIALFASHARRARPDRELDAEALTAIAELCRLLDGLPGAIGNAADWSLVLSWPQLLAAAQQDPLGIAEPPSAADGGWRAGVLSVVSLLQPGQAGLLEQLAGSDRGWTLEQLCHSTGRPPVELAKSLHALTLPGLLSTTRTAAGPSFAVPQLIRRVLRPR